MSFDLSDLPQFEPIRDKNGEPLKETKCFLASEVDVFYFDAHGSSVSRRPCKEQKVSMAAVFAPGINPLSVTAVRFSDIDFYIDDLMKCYVTYYVFDPKTVPPIREEYSSPDAFIAHCIKEGTWKS